MKDKEFENGLTDFYDILLKWKEEQPENNRDTYHKLFEKVYSFNKHIAHYYDRISGSDYFMLVAYQLNMSLINEKDIDEFSETAKEAILMTNKIFKKNQKES